MAASQELAAELGSMGFPGPGDAELWRQAHVLLMHASPGLANTWRKKLQQAVGQQCNNDSDACELLPWDREEPVFPGFGRPVETKGTLLSPEGLLDPRLGSGPFSGTAAFLARVVSIALWLLESDRSLHHALRPCILSDWWNLRSPTEGDIRRPCSSGWKGSRQRNRVATPLRFSKRGWTWMRPSTRCSTILQVRRPLGGDVCSGGHEILSWSCGNEPWPQGIPFTCSLLSGRYAEVKQFTNPDSDRTTTGSVPPGDVVVCLRIYLRLDGTVYPGRVLYRPR